MRKSLIDGNNIYVPFAMEIADKIHPVSITATDLGAIP